MENTDNPSLTSQIFALQTQHRALDVEIARLQEFPYIDQLQIQRLKKQKLKLKQTIARLKGNLIPDLDA